MKPTQQTTVSPPVALTIAGSDCSAGAGIQADLKTFQCHDVYGLSAITSIVAETPRELRQLEPVSIPLLQDQINILLETYPINAIKIGLLPSRRCVIAVAESLQQSKAALIIDPVMVSSTGHALMEEDASATLIERLLPMATLITPNIPEAELILGEKISNKSELEAAAKKLSEKLKTSCLIKGGHLTGEAELLDILWHDDKAHHFSHKTQLLQNNITGIKGLHGTGCTLSSAITAGIAQRKPLEKAVEEGITFVQNLITNAHTWKHKAQQVQSLGWC